MSAAEADLAEHLRPPNPKRYSVSRNRAGDASVHLGYRDLAEIIDMVYAVMDATTGTGDGHAADDAFGRLLNQLYHVQASTYDGTFVVSAP